MMSRKRNKSVSAAGRSQKWANRISFIGGIVAYCLIFLLYQTLDETGLNFKIHRTCTPEATTKPLGSDHQTRTNQCNQPEPDAPPNCGAECAQCFRSQSQLLLIGVITAENLVSTRAATIRRTWAQEVSGKVLYFVGSSARIGANASVPLHVLPQVSDQVYPPQRKFWRMLQYMHDCCRDDYDWFMRADDDLFLRPGRLERLLLRLNSSQPLYIGQAGQGAPEHQLFWDKTRFFCMSGSGLVLSRALLARIAPVLTKCARYLIHSEWDDAEFGRCVAHQTNVDCTKSFEMMTLFYNNRGRLNSSFNHSISGFDLAGARTDPFDASLLNAVALHPVKDPRFQHRISHFDSFKQLITLERRRVELQRSLLRASSSETRNQPWHAFATNVRHSPGCQNPAIGLKADQINALPRRLLQEVTLREPARAKQAFADSRAAYSQYGEDGGYNLHSLLVPASSKFNHSRAFRYRETVLHPRLLQVRDLTAPWRVYLVLPVCGPQHSAVLDRFIATYVALVQPNENGNGTTLLLVSCHGNRFDASSLRRSGVAYEEVRLEKQAFSRAAAMNAGATHVHRRLTADAILLFVDVDMQITSDAISRVRYNTRRGQVYYPIVLVAFDPEADGVKRARMASPTSRAEFEAQWFPEGEDGGHWSFHGFGMVAMHASDWWEHARWNEKIVSWGMEDVELHDRILLDRKLSIFRAPEPGMVHAYHAVNCTMRLAELAGVQTKVLNAAAQETQESKLNDEKDRYRMCLGSQYSHIGTSTAFIKRLRQNA